MHPTTRAGSRTTIRPSATTGRRAPRSSESPCPDPEVRSIFRGSGGRSQGRGGARRNESLMRDDAAPGPLTPASAPKAPGRLGREDARNSGGGTRNFKRLLVAGGAGFIGSNFVRLLRQTRPEVEITVLDKLTYAGNPANLAEFEGSNGYTFVHGDICDASVVDSVAADVDAIVNFAAETHVDRSLMEPLPFTDTPLPRTPLLCQPPRHP